MKVGREIVDFHGEMVLLENYSALNYTGTNLYLVVVQGLQKSGLVLKRLTFWLCKCA